MTPVKHKLCNDVLRAPAGDSNCQDLPIMREQDTVWSFWKPTAEELAAIVKGGEIALCVHGQTHPPLLVGAVTTDYKGTTTDPSEIMALYEANRERCNAIFVIAKKAVALLVKATGREHMPLADELIDLTRLNSEPDKVVRELAKGGEQ